MFPCPRACLRIWSRETGSAVPFRVRLLISSLMLNPVLTYGIFLEFRGSVDLFIKNKKIYLGPSTRGRARGRGGSGGGPGGVTPPGTAAVSKHETGTVTKQTNGCSMGVSEGDFPPRHGCCVQARDRYCD